MGSLMDAAPDSGAPDNAAQQQTGLGRHGDRCAQRDPHKARGTKERDLGPEASPGHHTHSSRMEAKWGGCFNRGLRWQTVSQRRGPFMDVPRTSKAFGKALCCSDSVDKVPRVDRVPSVRDRGSSTLLSPLLLTLI